MNCPQHPAGRAFHSYPTATHPYQSCIIFQAKQSSSCLTIFKTHLSHLKIHQTHLNINQSSLPPHSDSDLDLHSFSSSPHRQKMKMNQLSPAFLLLLLFASYTLTSAQAPAAAPASPADAPAPPGPTNVTAVLEKASQFTTFIRLLQNTKVADTINTQLNTSSQGITIFAPTDSAFSNLKAGTLNSFTDEQKVQLIQFHVLPTFYSPSQFQTASNPLNTQAGSSQSFFGMNVTTSGNSVNITTGMTNATVANTVYTDGQLAVYQVDKVLLPLGFFVTPPPAPAPSKHKKPSGSADSPSGDISSPADSSTANCLSKKVFRAMAYVMIVIAAFL